MSPHKNSVLIGLNHYLPFFNQLSIGDVFNWYVDVAK